MPNDGVSTSRYGGSAASAPGAGIASRRISRSWAISAPAGLYDPPVRPLRIATLGAALAAALLLAGCGKQDPDPVPTGCVGEQAVLLAALTQAPRAVALPDGTRLSRCVSTARSDGDLQSLGISLGRVADTLRARAATDPDAALQLGYLAGAVRAGARRASSGIADQLARRMTQLGSLAPGASAASAAALTRGARAGESSG